MSLPSTYKGWTITWDYGQFWAISPDYDASYEGPEEGWVDNGLRTSAKTLLDLYYEIDAILEEPSNANS